MSKKPSEILQNANGKLLPEYEFDYQKAKPNRFITSSTSQPLKVVVLDEDVAQVFTPSEAVKSSITIAYSIHTKLTIKKIVRRGLYRWA